MIWMYALCIALWYALVHSASGQELHADKMSLAVIPAAEFSVRATADAALLRAVRLRVFDGKQKGTVRLSAMRVWQQGKSATVDFAPTRTGLAVRLTLQPHGRCIVWRVECRNGSAAQMWIELGLEMQLATAASLTLFDGYQEIHSPSKAVKSEDLRRNFPLAIAWTTQAAVGVGVSPTELVSYLRHEYRPEEGGVLGSYARIVVDPGATESVSFVTCATRGEWGEYEVFEAYYDSFPSYFRARPDVDPRATMGGAEYRAYPVRAWSPELCRRLWAGWEWCYAPFRRTGDIVGRKELWDYKPARPFRGFRAMKWEEFHAWRKKAFADGEKKCNVAMMFYVPAQIWCEERLARERYADALTTDPRVRTYFGQPWVTPNDNESRVFPYGTSFGRQGRADMRQVAEELQLSGFAFDTAGGVARYRGPALARLKHRAWDDDGVFCNENVAVALLMDFVHSLRVRGRPLAVVANIGTGVYTSCLHCDSAMFEGEPWKGHRTAADPLRWKMGHKTCVWWEGYGLQNFVDVDRVTAAQAKAIYRGLADFTLLQSLRIGLIPPPNFTQGMRKLVHWLPAITDCVRAGWEPVPAARAPEPLWTSRYGRGVETCIVVAHETGEARIAEVTIENERLGPDAYLFVPYHGGALTNRIVNGETRVQVRVPVRTPVLLRAVGSVSPCDAISRAEVSAAGNAVRRTVVIRFTAARRPARIILALPKDMTLDSASLDGQTVPLGKDLSFAVPAGREGELNVKFRSAVFDAELRELLDFPFVRDGKPNCVIVCAADAAEDVRIAAYRIQEYFRYWYGRACKPTADVCLPIRGAQTGGAQAVVLLRVGGEHAPKVAVRGTELKIAAPNPASLKATVFKLLRVFDTRYGYPDQLSAARLHVKLGLAGTVLEPEDKR